MTATEPTHAPTLWSLCSPLLSLACLQLLLLANPLTRVATGPAALCTQFAAFSTKASLFLHPRDFLVFYQFHSATNQFDSLLKPTPLSTTCPTQSPFSYFASFVVCLARTLIRLSQATKITTVLAFTAAESFKICWFRQVGLLTTFAVATPWFARYSLVIATVVMTAQSFVWLTCVSGCRFRIGSRRTKLVALKEHQVHF